MYVVGLLGVGTLVLGEWVSMQSQERKGFGYFS